VVVLAGWSFGGLVAYEIAKQLQASGGPKVTQLVLIDWVEPGMAAAGGHNSELGAVGALVRSVELASGSKLPSAVLDAAVQRIASMPLDAKIGEAIALLETNGLLRAVDDSTRAELGESVKSFEHAIGSLMRHQGQTSLADVSSFAATGVAVLALSSSAFGLHQMARFDWTGAGPQVETAIIDGDHWEILKSVAAVGALAGKMKAFLAKGSNVASSMLSATDTELAQLITTLQVELASRK
jgi:thioesterase domain-containing protein